MDKEKLNRVGNTYLALLTSLFILFTFIYSFVVNEPLYKLSNFLYQSALMISIITLAIHANAYKQNVKMRSIILVSLLIPIGTLLYTLIGFIIMVNNGV